ncbi:MAG: helix-turn-helix transcriptional regulator [Methylocystaceae bacterium]
MQNRIRELREHMGITQEDLGIRVGVSRQTIISLERGKYNPSISLAYRLARTFNLKIEDVFTFTEEGKGFED